MWFIVFFGHTYVCELRSHSQNVQDLVNKYEMFIFIHIVKFAIPFSIDTMIYCTKFYDYTRISIFHLCVFVQIINENCNNLC